MRDGPEMIEGHGVLEHVAERFAPYVAISDDTVWSLVGPGTRAGARLVVLVESLEEAWLDAQMERLRDGGRPGCLFGVGGGRATDAAKYLAHRLDCPYVLVPTNTASNAPFNGLSAVRRAGATLGVRVARAPEAYVLDYDLIAHAPPAVNRAGVGDMLLLHTMPYDWDVATRAGKAPADPATRADIEQIRHRFFAGLTSADPVDLLPVLLQTFRDHTALVTRLPDLPIGFGSEHLFAWSLEQVLGREVLHGAAVALGALLMAQVQDNDPDRVLAVLRRTQAPWHPERDLGVGWPAVAEALAHIADYNARTRSAFTVLDERPLDGASIDRLVATTRRWGG
jgi:glycerol dehydrogenase-like iron-containing ADH family enzyme